MHTYIHIYIYVYKHAVYSIRIKYIFHQNRVSKADLSLSLLKAWLRQFGYLSQISRQMSTMQSAQILSKAISDMQRFYGLEVTGEMDPATAA